MILLLALLAMSPVETRICDLINARRADNGRPALAISAPLYAAAKAHSDDMAANGCYQHNSCSGEFWSTRIRRYYPNAQALGETINFGGTPEEIVSTWMTSDAHRSILLSTAYTEVGCAATLRHTNFGDWNMAVADFGNKGFITGPSATPRPTATPGQTVPPVAIEDWQLRASSKTRSTLTAKLLVPPGSRIDAAVALELDGVLVVSLSDKCVITSGRGAKSVCELTPRVRITPSRQPYYRIRLEFPGVYEPGAVRLSMAGQSWELR